MKNIFYFIFSLLIISCNNDKKINTTKESNNLLDSVIELEATDEKALQHININDLILHAKKSAL